MNFESYTAIKGDLKGVISVKLNKEVTLDDICLKFVKDYNPDRLEAMAIRIFQGKELMVTIYAVDKKRQEGNNFSPDKMPVKKIKLEIQSISELLPFMEEYNFTLTNGNYPMEDMEVINK